MFTIATTPYTVEEVLLQDDTTVLARPATIAKLRLGQEMLGNLGNGGENADQFHQFLDIIAMLLENQRPEYFNRDAEGNVKKVKGKRSVNYGLMEEAFDMELVFHLIDKFLGVKLNDPNLLARMAEMVEEQNGQTSA